MVAFGNSISRGANCVGLKETPEYSWSTGTKIDSHLKRLEDQRHVMVVAKNVARVGVNSPDLKNQLKKMGEFVPDYATMKLGLMMCVAMPIPIS
jgi:hypothetical protein